MDRTDAVQMSTNTSAPEAPTDFRASYADTLVLISQAAVPPLDDDTEDLLEDLSGIHPGLDQIRAGFRLLMLDRHNRDETQTILAALAGTSDGTDVLGLVAAAISRLTNPTTNPCLRTIAPDVLADVRRIGYAAATELGSEVPRDLVAGVSGRIDPYAHLS